MKTSLRTWLRSTFVLVAAAAAFALPATASAATASITEARVSAWAGESSSTVTVTFTAHTSWSILTGTYKDKVSGFSFSDSENFTVTQTNCAIGTTTDKCTVTVKFNAPANPTQPLYIADLNLMSNFDGTQYDGKVRFYAFAGVKGVDGEQGPGCVVLNDAPNEGTEMPALTELPEGVVECPKGEQGDKGETGAPGTNGTNGTNGADGVAGAAGATGATGATGSQGSAGPAGLDGAPAPQAAALVVSKVVTVRTSCMVKRNRLKQRVAYCLVKTPKNTPASKWTMFAGGTRIATGNVKSGVREFRVTKALGKTVGGWITVTVTKK